MSSGSRVVMIISSWYFDLVRIILSDEVLVDELIAGGELVDDLVEPPDLGQRFGPGFVVLVYQKHFSAADVADLGQVVLL